MPAWARRAHSGAKVIAKMTAPQIMALDQALAELNVPEPDPGRWAGQLAEVARQMRAIIGRHRDLVPSSIGFLPGGGRALRCHERVLAIMRAGGLPDSRAVAGLYLLWVIVNGFSLEETRTEDPERSRPDLSPEGSRRNTALAALWLEGDVMSTNPGLLGALGAACYRHRWVTVLAWIAGVACLITLWMRFGAAAQNSFTSNDPGQALLNEHFAAQSGDTLTLAIRSDAPVTSPAVQARVTQALAPFRQAAHVTGVSNPYTTPGQLSADGHIAYATIQFDVPGSSIPGSEATALIHDARAASGNGVTFSLGGDVVDLAETPYGGPSNGIGVGAAAIVLLIAFGSLLAMGLPIATALMGIGSGLALIALLGHIFPAPGFTAIIAALIGLGVGVDYALFILTRFRQELRGVPGHGVRGVPGQAERPPGPAQRADLQDGMQPQD